MVHESDNAEHSSHVPLNGLQVKIAMGPPIASSAIAHDLARFNFSKDYLYKEPVR